MLDKSLEIVAQIRDMATAHLKAIGRGGKEAGQEVAKGMAGGERAATQFGAGVLKTGQQFQLLRRTATSALIGVGAGMAAAQSSGESMGQGVLRVGMSIAAGFGAGGPVGAALAGVGVLIGSMVGKTKQAEEAAAAAEKRYKDWLDMVTNRGKAAAEAVERLNVAREARASGREPGAVAEEHGLKADLAANVKERGWLARQIERNASPDAVAASMKARFMNGQDPGDVYRDMLRDRVKLAQLDETIRRQEEGLKALRQGEAEDAAAATAKVAQGLAEQAEARRRILALSEEERQYAGDLKLIEELRAQGKENEAELLERAVRAERERVQYEKDTAEENESLAKLQALKERGEEQQRILGLSEQDRQFQTELKLIEELRLAGEKQRADTLERAVRARQAELKAERESAEAERHQGTLRGAAEGAALLGTTDPYERERLAARFRAQEAARRGDELAGELMLKAELADIDRRQAEDQKKETDERKRTNEEAQHELDLLRAGSDLERAKVEARREYNKLLADGVNKRTADAIYAERVAKAEADAAKEKEKGKRADRGPGDKPAGMTDKEWEFRKKRGLSQFFSRWGEGPVQVREKGGPGGAGPTAGQDAAAVQAKVDAAAGKIPDLSNLPDPSKALERAAAELAKVPPAFDRTNTAAERFRTDVKESVERVGKAAAKAVDSVARDQADLRARVRKVEDALANAGKAGGTGT